MSRVRDARSDAQPNRQPGRRGHVFASAPWLGLMIVRYGIGVILVVAGLVALIADPGGFGVDGFAMGAGAGGSVLMLNWLYRIGVRSDEDRVHEEQARAFLAEHGRWPPDH